MYGVRNCPEGQLYYDSLIELYASWGVDFIKCDDICNTNAYPHAPYSGKHEIEMLHNAIMKVGRPIVLSLSPGPALIEQAWHYEKNANMWRITDDLWDQWDLLKDMFDRCELWENQVSEGCFPDCDMLPFGIMGKGFGGEWKCNLTYDEQKTMMSLWCIFGSPLMLGGEMPLMDDATVGLLTNADILAMLPPYVRASQYIKNEKEVIWFAVDEKTNDKYVAIFNISDETNAIMADVHDIFEMRLMDVECTGAKELWTGDNIIVSDNTIEATISAHGCCVYKF